MLRAAAIFRLLVGRLVPVALTLWATGCSTSYPVKVQTASAGRPSPGLAYRIQLKGVNPDGVVRLREAEAASVVKTALSGRGMFEAPAPGRADVVIEVEFGVEPVREDGAPDRAPIYAEIPGGVREEVVTMTGADGKTTTETVRVKAPPRREVIGYHQLVDAAPVYRKFLRIQAREARPAEKGAVPKDLWSVRVTSEDRSDDLRHYLPVLASVTMRALAGEVHSEEIRVPDDDPDVAFVRRGL